MKLKLSITAEPDGYRFKAWTESMGLVEGSVHTLPDLQYQVQAYVFRLVQDARHAGIEPGKPS